MKIIKLYGSQISEYLGNLSTVFEKTNPSNYDDEDFCYDETKTYFHFFFSKIKYVMINEGKAGYIWFILEKQDKPIGHLSLRMEESKCNLQNISIHEEYRGEGLSSLMIEELVSFCLMNNFTLETGTFTEDGKNKIKNKFLSLSKKHPELNFHYINENGDLASR